MSSKEHLLDALDSSREGMLVAIEFLPDQALLVKQAVGEWSVSDTLINITAWEAELVTGLMRLRQDKRPDKLLEALREPSKFDRRCFLENQDRDLDQVFHDFQQVRVQIEEWILEFSEGEINNQRRYKWLNGRALKEIIAAVSFERESKLVPKIELFSQQWQMSDSNDSIDRIPLTPINLNSRENNHDEIS